MNDIPIIPRTRIGWAIERRLAQLEAANRLVRLLDAGGRPVNLSHQATAFRARWELDRFLRRLSAVDCARERRAGMAIRGMFFRWRSDRCTPDEWTFGNE
jgi:hypothetical protein